MKPALADLITAIYGAAEQPSQWTDVLAGLASVTRSSGACLVIDDAATGVTEVIGGAHLDPAGIAEYNSHYHAVDLFMENGRKRRMRAPVTVLASNDGISDAALVRSEFYQDFLRRYDLFYNLSGVLEGVNSSTAVYCSLHRSSRAGPYTDRNVQVLEILMPHLRRACQLQRRLAIAKAGEEAMNSLQSGVLLVDAGGKVVFMNSAARRMVRTGDGIVLTRHGRLLANGCDLYGRMRSATPYGCIVRRPSGKRSYFVQVVPVHAGAALPGSPAAMVWVADLDESEPIDPAALQQAFDLTKAEARVAVALYHGKRPAEICRALAISAPTVRTHLRHIFEKLGVARQAEAVAVLARVLRAANAGTTRGGTAPDGDASQ